MQVEMKPINDIKPYEHNPRVNDGAVDAVARSIAEFGFRQPLVVDESGVVVVGHTRWKAAKKLGMTEVPVHVARGLSPAQLRAYRIADNQTATIAEWDEDLLTAELLKLQSEDYDLSLTGLDGDELLKYLEPDPSQGQTDPDDVPAQPDAAITQPGDLILLGRHRLLCGDSSKCEDVDRLLDGQPVQLVLSDPPYNVKVEPRSNNAIAAGLSSFPGATHHQKMDVKLHPDKAKPTTVKLRAKDRPLANDFVPPDEFERLLRAWFGNLSRVLEPGRSFYIWGGFANLRNYPAAIADSGLHFAQTLIWVKGHPVLTRKDFMTDHEWMYYGWREGAGHQFFGPNNVTDVWQVKKVSPQTMVHLTQKPVELATRALEYSSRAGERVLDLFGGSGTTLMGCEQLGRVACLMEIDALYCDVIVTRWEQFTGKKAVRPGRVSSE